MRKILVWITAVMMVFGMAACSSSGGGEDNTAEAAVIGLLDALKAGDQEKVNQYVSPEDLLYAETIATDEETEMTKIVLGNMTYEVVSSSESETEAVVKVDITTVDMAIVMQEYMQKALTAAADTTTEEAMQMLQETIDENKDTTVSSSVEVNVVKMDDGWKVETDEALYSAVTGGLSDMG